MDRKDAREKLIELMGETKTVYILMAEATADPGYTAFYPIGDLTVNVKFGNGDFKIWTE